MSYQALLPSAATCPGPPLLARSARFAVAVLTAVASLEASSAAAQDDVGYPSPEEYAARAAEASALPLFASLDPLPVTLRTDIEWLRDERNDSVEVGGTVTFAGPGGALVERPVDVRARGDWRRDKRNCNFPPLRLDFPKDEMEGTVFEGQDKLKLVTPCHDGRDSYQEYVLKEYLAYRTYQQITPMSHRVRLVEITYEDVEGDYDTRTKIGFLIESDEHMAARNGALHLELEQLHPANLDGDASVTTDVFNYMIGFTDMSQAYLHNVKLIRTGDGRHVPVSYDFDFAGVVDARYATPDPRLPIRHVTDRMFRGWCRPELRYESVAIHFDQARDRIREEVEGFTLLDEDARDDVLDYYEGFWTVIDDPRRFEREIVRACRHS